MKSLKTTLKNLWKDESGQGATEYILLLVIIVGLAMLFKGEILSMVTNKLTELRGNIESVTAGG